VLIDTIGGSTWELGVPGFAVAHTFGDGCGAARLTAAPVPGSRPVLGQVQGIDVQNVPGPTFMCYGWSATHIGAFSLPLPLDAFGMPGCDLLQSIDLLLEPCVATGPTTVHHDAAIPNLPFLLGVQIYLQPWAIAPLANPAGLVTGNAVSLLLGSQ
jgi:hypothetical protein